MKRFVSSLLITSFLISSSLKAQEVIVLEDMQKIADKPCGVNSGEGAGIYRDKDNRTWFVKTIDKSSGAYSSEGNEVARNYAASRLLRDLVGPESAPLVMPVYSRAVNTLLIGSQALEGFNTAWEVYWKDIYKDIQGETFNREAEEMVPLKEKRAREREALLERDALLKVALSLLGVSKRGVHAHNRGVVSLPGASGNRSIAAVVDFDTGAFSYRLYEALPDFQQALEASDNYREAIHHIASLKEEELATKVEAIAAELDRIALSLPPHALMGDSFKSSFLLSILQALPTSWTRTLFQPSLMNEDLKHSFLSSLLQTLPVIRAMDELLYANEGLCQAERKETSDPKGELLRDVILQDRLNLAWHLMEQQISNDPQGRALSVAIQKGYDQLVTYLLDHHLTQDPQGRALEAAILSHQDQVVTYLLDHHVTQDLDGRAR